jgi:hypothetical protein
MRALALGGTLSSNFATCPDFIRRNRLSHSFDNRFISARNEYAVKQDDYLRQNNEADRIDDKTVFIIKRT